MNNSGNKGKWLAGSAAFLLICCTFLLVSNVKDTYAALTTASTEIIFHVPGGYDVDRYSCGSEDGCEFVVPDFTCGSGYTYNGWTLDAKDDNCSGVTIINVPPPSCEYRCLNNHDDCEFDCKKEIIYYPCCVKVTGSEPGSGGVPSSTCSSTNMYKGCSNTDDIIKLQNKLNEVQKCNLTADGVFGDSTDACVKAFQSANGLTADGIVGTRTLSALNSESSVVSYYTIVFDTDKGHFINGETKRNVIVTNNDFVSKPSTIPGKDGYKFIGWYNGDTKYDFSEKATSNLTLTAHWEKVDSNLSCKNKNDVLDYETKDCITAQTFDSNNYSGKVFDLNNTGIFQTIQTKNVFDRTCDSGHYQITANEGASTGAKSSVACGDGYTKELWKSADTCNSSMSCNNTSNDTCYRLFNAVCFKNYKAEEGNNKSDDELDGNAKTGNIMIFMAWMIGIGALGYSIYYFKKRKEI